MASVWIVDERDYDDYTFYGAFATEEAANGFADLLGGGIDVTEIEILTEVPHQVKYYFVSMEIVRGTDPPSRVQENEDWSNHIDQRSVIWTTIYNRPGYDRQSGWVSVWDTDRQNGLRRCAEAVRAELEKK